MEAIRGQNDRFYYRWKCNVCESGKIIKSDSRSPFSNLKQHIQHSHPDNLDSFLKLREAYVTKRNNPPYNTVFIQKI